MLNERDESYKWVVIIACFVMIFVTLGFCSAHKSLYLGAICDLNGFTRTQFSFHDSLRFIATALVNMFFGFLIAKTGPKLLIGLGFASLALSTGIQIFATKLWQFYLSGILLGIGLAWCTTTMVSYLVTRWYPERKGTIMGLVLCANGLGGAVAAQLITDPIKNSPTGYQDVYKYITLGLCIVGVLATIAIREPENEEGKGVVEKKKAKGRQWEGIEFSQAVKSPLFIVSALLIFLTGVSLNGINGVSSAYLKDLGFDSSVVKNVASIHSIVLCVSKFATGFLYDKKGLRFSMLFCQICAVLAFGLMGCLEFMNVNGVLAIVIAYATYGVLASLALPLETVIVPLIASDLFGQKSFVKMLGIFVSVLNIGYAVGAPVCNMFYDKFGSYANAMFAVAIVIAVVLVVFEFVLTAAEKQRNRILAQNFVRVD